jgi:hypothetical protein
MRKPLVLLIATLFAGPAAAGPEPATPDARARYCLDVLHLQESMVHASGRPREAEALLGSAASLRAASRQRLEAYVASRELSLPDADAARKSGHSVLAKDMTDLVFAAPDPNCRRPTPGLCVLEAYMRTAAATRQADCVGALAWLPDDAPETR